MNYNHMKDPVEIQLSEQGKNLYIFFGGIASGIVMPVFEFYRASKILDDHKIFLRDLAQCWYQVGLPPISRDIETTAQYLNAQIDRLKPEKVYFVGNSMGGYAAILFASLVGVGEAIAFAPQTFIDPYLRFKYRDKRWRRQIFNTYKKSVFKHKVWDLRPLLMQSNNKVKISVFVSRADRLDYIHALHISDIEGVKIHEFADGGHNVVRLLRNSGKLPDIMTGRYT